MSPKIKSQIYRMSVVFGLLVCLGIWQADFLLTSVSSNYFLNSSIFGTFAFGVYLVFRNVGELKNEEIAFNALKEDCEDVNNNSVQEETDPFWRYYRCMEKAQVFKKPNLLDQPYQLITEEIARTGKMYMSTVAMQNMIDSIDDRIDERKSLVQYITGILVFLGLIGTFIGLMITLGSVGNIIGSLNLSDGAGNEAIQKLMTDLQIPLDGMATGFSSSLFGLITSLALGLMARFSAQAASVIKQDFENWAIGMTQVNVENKNNSGSANDLASQDMSLIYRTAKMLLVSNARMNDSLSKTANAMEELRESQLASQKATLSSQQYLHQMAQIDQRSCNLLEQIANSTKLDKETRHSLANLQNSVEKQSHIFSKVNETFLKLNERQQELYQNMNTKNATSSKQEEFNQLVAQTQKQMAQQQERLNLDIGNFGKFLREINYKLGTPLSSSYDASYDESLKDDLKRAETKPHHMSDETKETYVEKQKISVSEIQQHLRENFGELDQEMPSNNKPSAPHNQIVNKR